MALQGVLHRVFAFLIMPVLGYLLGATIFTHFWDKVEIADADLAVTALSCKEYGPVTWRGFGFVSECRARVENKVSGGATLTTVRGFLAPHLVGEQVVVREFRRGEVTPERPSAGWGIAVVVLFGVVWLYLSAWVAQPLLPDRRVTRSGGQSRLRPPLGRAR
ncbi:DUF6346 domain-containing protein [Lentzea albidocapillata]|uniref:DUF3592 domain-containing protein n=1 Tax=Lentzea albidocapillata TaxID=40571 RepID=A0A1W2FUP6_9PSEU|nr:DUF6346 domain-containing protein [Lentzea albidocapillata]SMD25328.1 hypothetical protein SAMN05660733_08110 [Lentzea albidocapillata]